MTIWHKYTHKRHKKIFIFILPYFLLFFLYPIFSCKWKFWRREKIILVWKKNIKHLNPLKKFPKRYFGCRFSCNCGYGLCWLSSHILFFHNYFFFLPFCWVIFVFNFFLYSNSILVGEVLAEFTSYLHIFEVDYNCVYCVYVLCADNVCGGRLMYVLNNIVSGSCYSSRYCELNFILEIYTIFFC